MTTRETNDLERRRRQLVEALDDVRSNVEQSFGVVTRSQWVLPLVAGGLGLALALALRRRLRGPEGYPPVTPDRP